ncbi:MAG: hypothetical protein ABNH23_14055, partial [Tateyamaria sp.]
MKTKAMADKAMIDRTMAMSPTSTIANPRAPSMAPQTVRILGDGFSSPPVPIIASVNPALTTLVTTNKNAATIVAVCVIPLRCLIPRFDGAILTQAWKEALWDKFVTGAPRQRTPSELQYSD